MVYGPVGGIFFARWGAIGKAHYNNDELVVLGRGSFCLCGEEKPKIVIREELAMESGRTERLILSIQKERDAIC